MLWTVNLIPFIRIDNKCQHPLTHVHTRMCEYCFPMDHFCSNVSKEKKIQALRIVHCDIYDQM